jgi:carboxypeptidase Taq
MSAYEHLLTRFERIANLDNALGILHWDADTMMPEGAAPARSDTLATLKVLRHELLADPALADLLAAAEQEAADQAKAAGDAAAAEAAAWQAANVREMRRQYVHATAVPKDLVEASSRAVSECEMAWRRDNDFPSLLPLLEEVLRTQRLVGQAKAAALGTSTYDALLDSYEPDGRSARIDEVFGRLASFLPAFTEAALEAQARRPAVLPLEGPFPIEAQRQLGLRLMRLLGFDFDRGRLDVSLHPFCGGAEDDVRITTRYDERDFARSLMGVLHETGHALYEQGRPAAFKKQPVGQARGMALHESQSLLVEMQACRSREFLELAAPMMREAFGGSGPAWETDNLHRLYTRVARGLIRVDADEVTYPAHVILRYRLERAMIEGDLALRDLPGAFRDGMRDLVGVTPPDDATGCMQDIHWPAGLWGYFPTYTLGAMTAAQLFDAAKRQVPGLLGAIARGDFGPLVGWLRTHVHAKGSLRSTDELLVEVTGKPLDAAVFEAHLRTRYLEGR